MATRLDLDWKYRDLQVVRLENELICLDVLPELGAKVWNLVHKPTGRNLLWHNAHLAPARQAFGAKFDDAWSGGWDELIPNDVPTPVAYGDVLPDHGEVWSQASEWDVLEASDDRVAVRFVSYTRVWPTRFEKTISLCRGDAFCRVQYRYTNLAARPFDFLWNIHPALAVSPATRLDIPARRGLTDPWSTDQFNGWTEYDWPYAVRPEGRKGRYAICTARRQLGRPALPARCGRRLVCRHRYAGPHRVWDVFSDRRIAPSMAISPVRGLAGPLHADRRGPPTDIRSSWQLRGSRATAGIWARAKLSRPRSALWFTPA